MGRLDERTSFSHKEGMPRFTYATAEYLRLGIPLDVHKKPYSEANATGEYLCLSIPPPDVYKKGRAPLFDCNPKAYSPPGLEPG